MINDIKIQLIGDNNHYLTLTENSDFPLNFAISDIKNPEKRKNGFSKTIKLAGTKNNNNILGQYYDVNIEALTFNINKIQKVNIIVNDEPFMLGAIMQLTSINKIQNDSRTEANLEYEVNIKSEQGDLFTTLKNRELTDLKFTTIDVPGNGDEVLFRYDADFVIDSWYNDYANGYKYIQQGVLNGNAPIKSYKLGIYLWTYFNKIIKEAGYRYSFDEIGVDNSVLVNPTIDTIGWRNIIIPNNDKQGDLVSAYVNYYKATADGNSLIEIDSQPVASGQGNDGQLMNSGFEKLTFDNEILDDSSAYNPTTSQYVVDFTGKLVVTVNQKYDIYFDNQSGQEVYSPSGQNRYLNYKNLITFGRNGAPINGSIRAISGSFGLDNNITYTFPVGLTYLGSDDTTGQFTFDVQPGDIIDVHDMIYLEQPNFGGLSNSGRKFRYSIDDDFAFGISTKYEVTDRDVRFEAIVSNGGQEYGGVIDVNNFIPKKIKQSDFLKSILQMFNIYCYLDNNDTNLLHFATRDNYYNSGEIKDFSKKKVKEKEHTLQFVSEISNKEKLFTYKQDKYILNEQYFNEFKETYGSARFIFDNEYVDGEDKIEVIFSPSPIIRDEDRLITVLDGQDSLRILYDGGVRTCNDFKLINYQNNFVTSNVYPVTTHLDNPFLPTRDLNFGTPKMMYYEFENITNNGLLNTYWRRTLHQINTSKLYTLYLNLSIDDIKNMKMNDIIFLDEAYWYINSIKDYNPTKTYITKVELISIDDLQSSSKGSVISVGETKPGRPNSGILTDIYDNIIVAPTPGLPNTGTVIGIGNIVRDKATKTIGNYNVVDGINNEVLGDNNNVTNQNNTVAGNNNNVTNANNNVKGNDNIVTNINSDITGNNNIVESPSIIFGDDNIVPPNIKNVLVIGDNLDINNGDGVYANTINANEIIIDGVDVGETIIQIQNDSNVLNIGSPIVDPNNIITDDEEDIITDGNEELIYEDEVVVPDGILVNENGVLAIIDNDTFVQEIVDEVEASLNIPTNTSDLVNDSDFQTGTQVTTAINNAISGVYKLKGSVADYASLPVSGNVIGDVWNTVDTGMNYVWTGTVWDELGAIVDLSNYYTISETDGAIQDAIDNITPLSGSTSIDIVGSEIRRSALTGDVTSPANSNVTTIADGAVTSLKIANFNVTGTQIAPNSVSNAKIAANAVSNAKLAQMPTMTIKGNNAGSTATPIDLTVAQVKTMLNNNSINITTADLQTLCTNGTVVIGQLYVVTDAYNTIFEGMTSTTVQSKYVIIRAVKDVNYTESAGAVKGVLKRGNSYAAGNIVIWGGRCWTKGAGTQTATNIPTDNLDINVGGTITNWTIIADTNNTYYEDMLLKIDGDIFSDNNTWSVADGRGNVFSGYDIVDGYLIKLRCDFGSTRIINNNVWYIINNSNRNASGEPQYINRNSNNGSIRSNSNNGTITDNDNNGAIERNTNNGSIVSNSNTGSIYNNSNTNIIRDNTNAGDIYTNSNTGSIQENSNTGSITQNSNTGSIIQNSSIGTISTNSNYGGIERNTNNGGISINSNYGAINQNSNNGIIQYNSQQAAFPTASASIYNNSNNGHIGGGSSFTGNKMLADICFNSNNGPIHTNSNTGTYTYFSDGTTHTVQIGGNANLGGIYNNSGVGQAIAFNRNAGRIHSNSNRGHIIFNYNNGTVDTCQSLSTGYNNNHVQNNGNNGLIAFRFNANNIQCQYNVNNGAINMQSNVTIQDTQVNKF